MASHVCVFASFTPPLLASFHCPRYVCARRYILHSARQPHFSYLWVVQHDVGWTADLPRLLTSVPAPAAGGPYDLVCVDHLSPQPASWIHGESRNGRHRAAYPQPLSSCLLPIVRYSRRLLHEIANELAADRMVYCEARAATACAARPWCRHMDLRDAPGLLGAFTHYSLINETQLLEINEINETQLLGDVTGERSASHALRLPSNPLGVESSDPALPQRPALESRVCEAGRLFHRVV